MARTDVHRPSDFDPRDYRVVDYLDNKRPDPPLTGDARAIELYEAYVAQWQAQVFSYFPDWRTGGDDHRSIFQCNHCGHQDIRYVAVVEHIPTGAYLAFGETCAERCELEGRNAFRARYIFDAAKRKLAAYEREQKRIAFAAAHGDLIEWLSAQQGPDVHPFLADMHSAIVSKGELTEKQLAATEKWRARDAERTAKFEARKAEEAAALANVAPLAEGRYSIEGIILSTKVVHGDYGTQRKMLVKMDDGNKVWGTMPYSIEESYYDDATGWTDPKGSRVAFTAKVQRSNDDQHFGFFSRPTNGKVMVA